VASLKSFFIKLALFSLITMGVLLLWQQYAAERFQTNLGWLIWGFFIAVTALIHIALVKASDESPRKFVTYFMAITGIKLFAYLIIILFYALLNGKAALGFVILFLVFYFLYSAFEVIILLKHLKK
jgi:hypothetical protein